MPQIAQSGATTGSGQAATPTKKQNPIVYQKIAPGVPTSFTSSNPAPDYIVGTFRPNNTIPIPPYGVGLDNRTSHFVGMSPNAPAYNAKYGYVPPYMRTDPIHYAKMTQGRTYKNAWTAEVPFRQVVKRGYPAQYVSSPGRNPNRIKMNAQSAITYQILHSRGLI